MRQDPAGSQLTQANRAPRLAIGLIYPTASIYITNRQEWRRVSIYNDDFEQGSTGWAIVQGTISAAGPHNGVNALRVTTGGTGARTYGPASGAGRDYRPDATDGKTYRLTAWVKRDESALPDSSLQISFRFETAAGASTNFVTATVSETVSGWQFVTAEGAAGASTTDLVVRFVKAGGASGAFFVDDVKVYEKVAIANVPGTVIHGALHDVAASGRELSPLEGRSTIASFDFSVVDVGGVISSAINTKLDAGEGPGRREVRVYTGDTDDFTDGTWSLVDTYVIDSTIELGGALYKFSCSDRQRSLRDKLFPARTTRLVADLGAADTTVYVSSVDGFDLVTHTASFTDAPSSTVVYFRVKKTGEVIRATGFGSPACFTGCTRGVLGTFAQALGIDETADVDKQPEIELVYYLEMPLPQLAYALLTGVVLDSGSPAITLPDDYHLGIDTTLVDAELFQKIGTDLYDPADPTAGLIFVFSTARGLKETDGKRFIEEQVLFPMWSFLQISAAGKFGLRRLTRLLSQAAPVADLTTDNIVSHGALTHRVGDVVNRIIVKWNHDGSDFTREDLFVNAGSISAHGLGQTYEYELLGLNVARHTRQTVQRIFDSISDRYASPPQEMELELSSTLNALEVGDVARVVLDNVTDYTTDAGLDRAFEIESRAFNPRTGELKVSGFASTATEQVQPEPNATPPLADAWYSSEGTALSSVLTISGNHVTANGSLTGNADLRNAVFYHLGDLTIDSGKTVTISDNVQLRIRGALTVNGKIDGKGRGRAAIVDPNTVGSARVVDFGNSQQTFGTTWAGSGITYIASRASFISFVPASINGVPAMPRYAFEVSVGALLGMPAELRGTEGSYGAPVLESSAYTVRAKGGAGGKGGAGLAIVSRGTLAFGASGTIDLSGADGSSPGATVAVGGKNLYPGAGSGGAPGTLLVLLDGNNVVSPDLTDGLVVFRGATPQLGNPIDIAPPDNPAEPWCGFYAGFGSTDLFSSAYAIQWVPQEVTPGSSADEDVPAPTNLAAASTRTGALVTWVSPPAYRHDAVQLWRATTNDRTGAVLIFEGKASYYFDESLAALITRYYWVRALKGVGGFSAWQPTGATSGVGVTFGGITGPGWGVDTDGKPAGMRCVQDATDRASLSFNGAYLRIDSATDSNSRVAFGHAAIPINDAKQYRITMRHKWNATSPDGHYLRVMERASALAAGKTHIGTPPTAESVCDVYDSYVDMVSGGPASNTSDVEESWIYTPTAGTKFGTLAHYVWIPTTAGLKHDIAWVTMTEVGGVTNLLPNARVMNTEDINAAAATQPYSLTVAGPNTYNAGNLPGGPSYYGSVSGSGIDALSVLQATLTADIVQTTAGATAQIWLELDWGIANQSSDIAEVFIVGSKITVPVQRRFTGLAANTPWTLKIRISTSGSGSFTISQTTLHAEVIKR
jgi:hypothetical protein